MTYNSLHVTPKVLDFHLVTRFLEFFSKKKKNSISIKNLFFAVKDSRYYDLLFAVNQTVSVSFRCSQTDAENFLL